MFIQSYCLQTSIPFHDKVTTINPTALDLRQFTSENNNRLLEFDNRIVGQVLVKDDCLYLTLDENAPNITLTDFPLQKKVIIEAANDIKIAQTNQSYVEGLAITANNIDISDELNISKAISLNAKQRLDVKSTLTSAEILCEARHFENNKPIKSSSSFTLKAEKVILAGDIEAKIIVLSAKNLEDTAELRIKAKEKMVILSDSANIKGNLDEVSNLFCKVNDLTILGSINNLDNVFLGCENLFIHEHGSVEFKNLKVLPENTQRFINAEKMILTSSAKGAFYQTKLSINNIVSNGNLNINDSTITADSLELNGLYSIQNSHCDVKNKIYFRGSKGALVKETVFEAQSCHFEDENKCQNVEFVTDNIEFLANTNTSITASRLDVCNEVYLNERSNTQWDHCNMYTNSAQFKGKAQLGHCDVESVTCVTSNQTTLESTNIEARLFWQDEGAQIKRCGIKATSSALLNKTNIEETKLITNSLISTGFGIFKSCKVDVNKSLSGTDKSNITFQQCLLKTEQTYTDGVLNFTQDSYHQTNYLQQTSGTIKINNSIIDNKGLFFSMHNASIIAEENAQFKAQAVLLNGESHWNLSKMAAVGPLIVCGKTSAQNTTIASVEDSIYLINSSKTFDQTTLNSKNKISVLSELYLSNQSELKCNTLDISSNKVLLENSRLNGHELRILNRFCAKKSHLTVGSNLNTLESSALLIEDSTIVAKGMSFMGQLDFARCELKAQANIIFENAKTHLNKVKFEVKETIVNNQSSGISGNDVETNSDSFFQMGTLKIQDLKVSSNTIVHSGTTESDKSVQFKANECLINTGFISAQDLKIQASSLFNFSGQIGSSKSTTIQTPLLINHMGDLTSSGALSMDSLVHFNLLGVERAYDYTSKSVYNGNYGLIIPNLPNTIGELFSTKRGLACAKMALTQWLPDYTNLLSLGWKAASYAKDSAHFLYDFYESNESIKNLPAKIYDSKSAKEFREQFVINEASDYLPCMMNVMSNGLSLMQLGNELVGAYNEVKQATAAPSSTHPNQEKEETETKTESSEEKSNASKAFEFIADIAINNFMPIITSQSIWGDNNGLMGGGIVTDSAYYESNNGLKSGWNFVGNYRRGVNRGLYAGGSLIMKGDSYTNEGHIANSKSANIQFKDSFTNAQGSSLNLKNFQIQTNQFTNEAKMDLSKGSIEATTFLQTETGKSQFSQTKAQIKENATLLGETTLNRSQVIAQNKLTQSGLLKGEEAYLEGEEVSLDGAHLQKSLIISNNKLIIKNTHTLDTGISGKVLDLSDSKFKSSVLPKETTEEVLQEETPETPQQKQEEAHKENLEPKELGENQIWASKSLTTIIN